MQPAAARAPGAAAAEPARREASLQVATHIRPQIPFADYREIFETIWQDRARAAGWTLAIDYRSPDGLDVVLRCNRSREAEKNAPVGDYGAPGSES